METIILIIAESIQIGANPYSVLGIYVYGAQNETYIED